MKAVPVCTLFTLAAVLLAPSLSADDWTVPRLPDGRPDLQGNWTNVTLTPLQRPERFGSRRAMTEAEARELEARAMSAEERGHAPSDPDRPAPTDGNTAAGYNLFWLDRGTNVAHIDGEYRSSMIIEPADGQIPYVEDPPPSLLEQWRSEAGIGDGPEVQTIGERCLLFWDFRSSNSSAGPPMMPIIYNSNYQIVQTADYVMIMAEMMHDARIIRINGEHQASEVVKWMGDSVGHWEGDTLVVTTRNYHPQQSHYGSSPELEVTERFTRVAEDRMVYRFTMNDPAVYSQAWTAELPMHSLPEGERLYEYACHEGNYALPGILAGARRQESQAE